MNWREVLKALHKIGFNPVRPTGSHIILEHADGRHTTVPTFRNKTWFTASNIT